MAFAKRALGALTEDVRRDADGLLTPRASDRFQVETSRRDAAYDMEPPQLPARSRSRARRQKTPARLLMTTFAAAISTMPGTWLNWIEYRTVEIGRHTSELQSL